MTTNDDAPLFAAHNFHPPDVSGTAPVIDWPDKRYSAYFENEHGEQWMLWQDDDGVHFACGDLGWDIYTFSIAQLKQRTVHLGLILGHAEHAWFLACFSAIRGLAYPDSRPTVIDLRPADDAAQRPKRVPNDR